MLESSRDKQSTRGASGEPWSLFRLHPPENDGAFIGSELGKDPEPFPLGVPYQPGQVVFAKLVSFSSYIGDELPSLFRNQQHSRLWHRPSLSLANCANSILNSEMFLLSTFLQDDVVINQDSSKDRQISRNFNIYIYMKPLSKFKFSS